MTQLHGSSISRATNVAKSVKQAVTDDKTIIEQILNNISMFNKDIQSEQCELVPQQATRVGSFVKYLVDPSSIGAVPAGVWVEAGKFASNTVDNAKKMIDDAADIVKGMNEVGDGTLWDIFIPPADCYLQDSNIKKLFSAQDTKFADNRKFNFYSLWAWIGSNPGVVRVDIDVVLRNAKKAVTFAKGRNGDVTNSNVEDIINDVNLAMSCLAISDMW